MPCDKPGSEQTCGPGQVQNARVSHAYPANGLDLSADEVCPVGPVIVYLLFGALSNVQARVESSSLKQHWVKSLLGFFTLTSANLSGAGRKGLVLLRAVPGVCCRAWVSQEMARAFGNLTISHDVCTYPMLRFPACSLIWS